VIEAALNLHPSPAWIALLVCFVLALAAAAVVMIFPS
jgi:hypothetical protein